MSHQMLSLGLIALLSFGMTACSDAPTPAATPTATPVAEGKATAAQTSQQRAKTYGIEVIAEYPHGEADFTQGLFFADGVLYESTGQYGRSQIIRHQLFGEATAARQPIDRRLFGEGAVAIGDKIYSVTWRAGVGLVHDLETLEPTGQFEIDGEGWGLTHDGTHLILSDGSNVLRFLDPETFEEVRSVAVVLNGTRPVPQLNELEFIDGEVWANIWQTDIIARINPSTGAVTGLIDLRGLGPQNRTATNRVLNGIAYDPSTGRLLVTGKEWPSLYEIKLIER